MVGWRAGFPFFSAEGEMRYYGVEDPYNRNYAYYRTEVLYPYVITAEEIVKTWEWFEIDEYMNIHGIKGCRRESKKISRNMKTDH